MVICFSRRARKPSIQSVTPASANAIAQISFAHGTGR